jgi:hypothetical protein
MPDFGLFPEPGDVEVWPQWNEKQEESCTQPYAESANARLTRPAKNWRIWTSNTGSAGDGSGPIGGEPLGHGGPAPEQRWRDHQRSRLPEGTPMTCAAAYAQPGWKADDALLRALACITDHRGQEAVFQGGSGRVPTLGG